MFEVVKSGENRLDIEFGGKLDKDEMKVALNELFESGKDIVNGKMMYRISDFNIPTLGAMGVELAHLPEALKFIRKFDRAAVLVDKQWVKKASEIEGALIPGLKIKAFDLDEEYKAEAWLEN